GHQPLPTHGAAQLAGTTAGPCGRNPRYGGVGRNRAAADAPVPTEIHPANPQQARPPGPLRPHASRSRRWRRCRWLSPPIARGPGARFSPTRFSLTGAASGFSGRPRTPVRRAAKRKTLFIIGAIRFGPKAAHFLGF